MGAVTNPPVEDARALFLADALRKAVSKFSGEAFEFFAAASRETVAINSDRDDTPGDTDYWIELQFLGRYVELKGLESHNPIDADAAFQEESRHEVLRFYVVALDGTYELMTEISVRSSGTVELWNEIHMQRAPGMQPGAVVVVGRLF